MNFKQLNEGFERKYGQPSESSKDFYEGLRIAIRQVLRQMNEAKISPEDKADSDALRNLYKKIGGKKTAFNKDEKALLKKYGLDAWGYMGDTKVTTADHKDLKQGNLRRYYGSAHDFNYDENEMNLADRARKMPQRLKDSDIAELQYRGRSDTYQGANNEYINRKMSQNYRDVKNALDAKKYYSDKAGNNPFSWTDSEVDRAAGGYANDVRRAEKSYNRDMESHRKFVDDTRKAIQKIKNKYSGYNRLESLEEAKMSPEDAHDTEVLRGIIKNNVYTPNEEEQKVLDKYGLQMNWGEPRMEKDIEDDDSETGRSRYNQDLYDYNTMPYRKSADFDKVNLADRARKMATRAAWGGKDSPYKNLNVERQYINRKMGKDYHDMKDLLRNQATFIDRKNAIEKDYEDSLLNAKANYDNKVKNLRYNARKTASERKKKVDDADATIKRILKRESLMNEAPAVEKDGRYVSTGLNGRINNDILHSVCGQLSDGMWENDYSAEKYWMNIDTISADNDIVVNNKAYYNNGKHTVDNPFYKMSDDDIRNFYANKIKRLAQQELTDNNLNPFTNWNADCDVPSSYLSYSQPVTIGDVYKAFKALKKGKSTDESLTERKGNVRQNKKKI